MFKIGGRLFAAEGPGAVEKLAGLGLGIFLDLKFHDIPSAVAGAVSSAAKLHRVHLITVHTLGGLEMMQAAVQARDGSGSRARLVGVTILTSTDARGMRQVGIQGGLGNRAVALAKLARRAGLDGVVSSAREVASIRRACGRAFLIVVPGVRPNSAGAAGHPGRGDDQARVATPSEAIRAGADYIVVGRPITATRDPRAAAAAIRDEILLAQRQRV